jgi:hypothetical protein
LSVVARTSGAATLNRGGGAVGKDGSARSARRRAARASAFFFARARARARWSAARAFDAALRRGVDDRVVVVGVDGGDAAWVGAGVAAGATDTLGACTVGAVAVAGGF